MKDFEELSKILKPLRKQYDLEMMKKQLKRVDRYRERLIERIKQLEGEQGYEC